MRNIADNGVGLDRAAGAAEHATAHDDGEFRMPDLFVNGAPYRLVTGSDPISYEPIPADVLVGIPSAYWREGC